jgi:N-acetylmuramoyl-L-alanine amidase
MKRFSLYIIISLITVIALSQEPQLKIVIPERTNSGTSSPNFRYGGNTDIGNRVTVNGIETKVYPTGAFVGLLSLETGANHFEFVATSPTGQTKTQTITVFRSPPPEPISENEIKLDKSGISPSDNQILLPGDILSLRIRGTPGAKVTASINGIADKIELTELPADTTKGTRGIYTGVYRIQPGDKVDSSAVTFHLEKLSLPVLPNSTELQSSAVISINSKTWPRVGMVTREDGEAYLNMGLGEARLGGAQLGFLPVSTKLVLDGKYGNQYRVRLCNDFHAYIPMSYVQELPEGILFPSSLPGGGNLETKGKYDIVQLSTNTRLPYYIEGMTNPAMIRIHIFGATSNFTWITRKEPLALIKDITWTQLSDDHLQVDLALYDPPVWGYDATYPPGSNGLRIRIRHKPEIAKAPESPLRGLTIAVDPGHGGSNTGAVGAMGIYEKACTLAMANMVKSKLETQGAKVIMTRTADQDVSIQDRINIALNADADMLVSIHCNSIGDGDPLKTRGTTTFYKFPKDRNLAFSILNRLVKIPGLPENSMVSSFNFGPIKITEIPSVLVETAYISNPEDEALVISDSGREQIAQGIVDGISDYFNSQR